MKIVLIESLGISKELLESYAEALRAQGHDFTAYERDLDVEVQKERLKDADILMIANMPLKAEVLDDGERAVMPHRAAYVKFSVRPQRQIDRWIVDIPAHIAGGVRYRGHTAGGAVSLNADRE